MNAAFCFFFAVVVLIVSGVRCYIVVAIIVCTIEIGPILCIQQQLQHFNQISNSNTEIEIGVCVCVCSVAWSERLAN